MTKPTAMTAGSVPFSRRHIGPSHDEVRAMLEVLPNDSLRISASINQPEGGEFLPLLEVKAKVGQSFIVAGQSYKNGILVLVIRVVK